MQIVRGSDLQYTPASHESPDDPGVMKKVLATRHDLLVGRVQMVNWALLPKGKSFARHYHQDMQEVFVIVSVEVDGFTDHLAAGDAILIDPCEVHRMTNVTDGDVRYVVFGISTGAGGQTIVLNDS